MSTLIYVETSIPSIYHEMRSEAEHQARRQWTREWWKVARRLDELVTSLAVIEELEEAPEPKRTKCISLLEPLPLLQSSPEVDECVAVYLKHKLMPADATGDARHLALATFHGCGVLATWNCQRLPALPCGLCSAQAISLRSVAGTLPIPTNADTLSE